MWWQIVLGVLGALLFLWLALVVAMYVAGRKESDSAKMTDALRLLPDVLRLVRRLAGDPTFPEPSVSGCSSWSAT